MTSRETRVTSSFLERTGVCLRHDPTRGLKKAAKHSSQILLDLATTLDFTMVTKPRVKPRKHESRGRKDRRRKSKGERASFSFSSDVSPRVLSLSPFAQHATRNSDFRSISDLPSANCRGSPRKRTRRQKEGRRKQLQYYG